MTPASIVRENQAWPWALESAACIVVGAVKWTFWGLGNMPDTSASSPGEEGVDKYPMKDKLKTHQKKNVGTHKNRNKQKTKNTQQ